MSKILRSVTHLNQAKAEATDSERCTIKTETDTGTASNEVGETNGNSSSSGTIKRRVIMPRRSERVPKGLCDQVMTNQDSSAAIRSKDTDNSTARGVTVTRKRNAEDSSFERSRKKVTAARSESFEKRCKQLIDFIDEFGHCHVPYSYSADPSLGKWCSTMRCTYNHIQQGQTPLRNITQDQIERLEEIGFKWKLSCVQEVYEQRCRDLEAFKSEVGHCNVPFRYSANPALGMWCIDMRCAYNKIQQGQKPKRNLTHDQIERLEEIGFKWKHVDQGKATFQQRYHDLETFKSEFGHCNVSRVYSVNPSFGKWCSTMRCTYNQIQQGQTPQSNLTQDQIERLEEIGFKWKLRETFEQRCRDLEAFKSEFGHCNVPGRYSVNPSLGNWCSTMRCHYNKIQQGQKPKSNLTQDRIECLEKIGFKWKLTETFEQRCRDLEAFNSEFGHCNVSRTYSVNPSLGQWCNATRHAYNQIQPGQTPSGNLTQGRIERLEEIGFKWKLK